MLALKKYIERINIFLGGRQLRLVSYIDVITAALENDMNVKWRCVQFLNVQ